MPSALTIIPPAPEAAARAKPVQAKFPPAALMLMGKTPPVQVPCIAFIACRTLDTPVTVLVEPESDSSLPSYQRKSDDRLPPAAPFSIGLLIMPTHFEPAIPEANRGETSIAVTPTVPVTDMFGLL